MWRDQSDFVLMATLDEPDHYEQLWVRRIADDQFKVCCIPFFLYDVCLADLVTADSTGENQFVISGVIGDSGRYVFRAYSSDTVEMRAVQDWCDRRGYLTERFSESLIAVDASNREQAQDVADQFSALEVAGRIQWETGRSRDPG